MTSAQDLLDQVSKALGSVAGVATRTYTVEDASSFLEGLAQSVEATQSMLRVMQNRLSTGAIIGGGVITDLIAIFQSSSLPNYDGDLAQMAYDVRAFKSYVISSGVAPSGADVYDYANHALLLEHQVLLSLITLGESPVYQLFSVASDAVAVLAAALDKLLKLLKAAADVATYAGYFLIAAAVVVGGYIVYQVAKPKVGQLIESGRRRLKAA